MDLNEFKRRVEDVREAKRRQAARNAQIKADIEYERARQAQQWAAVWDVSPEGQRWKQEHQRMSEMRQRVITAGQYAAQLLRQHRALPDSQFITSRVEYSWLFGARTINNEQGRGWVIAKVDYDDYTAATVMRDSAPATDGLFLMSDGRLKVVRRVSPTWQNRMTTYGIGSKTDICEVTELSEYVDERELIPRYDWHKTETGRRESLRTDFTISSESYDPYDEAWVLDALVKYTADHTS